MEAVRAFCFVHHRARADHRPRRNRRGLERRERDTQVQVPQILGPLRAAEALVDARVAGPEDECGRATRREVWSGLELET